MTADAPAAGAATPPFRLTVVSHYYPAHRGGVEIVAGAIAGQLCLRHRCRIEWFASDCDEIPRGDAGGALQCRPQPSWNGVERLTGLPWPLWSPASFLRLWRSIAKADAVHVHDYLYAASLTAFLIAALQRKPVVVSQHVPFIPYRSAVLRAVLSVLNRGLGRFCLRHVHRVIFMSPRTMDYFSGFTRWKRTPRYIPNGVDCGLFFPRPADRDGMRRALSLAEATPLLLFVGRFTARKGLDILRQLAEAIPAAHWAFAGHGLLRPQDWGLANVSVHENLSGARLASLYRAADLLVLPSCGESFPLVIQEAMACGLPCVVSAESAAGSPAARDLLICPGLGSPGPVEAWQACLSQWLNDPGLRRDRRDAVARFAADHWSWSACADAIWECLAEAAPTAAMRSAGGAR